MTRAIKYQETDGKKVGEHSGAHYFTIGQRKGLNVGGKAEGMFVIATDTITNTIYVGMGDQHPGLLRNGLFVPQADVHWIREDLQLAIGEEKDFLLRIRYRQTLANGRLYQRKEGIYILFEHPTKAIAAGQFAAWYLEDELVGSGVIS